MEIRFVYDEESDSYILKSDKRIIIDTGDNDLIMFSKNTVVQSSEKLHFNPVPHYKYTGDLHLFTTTMDESIALRLEEMNKNLTELSEDGGCEFHDHEEQPEISYKDISNVKVSFSAVLTSDNDTL